MGIEAEFSGEKIDIKTSTSPTTEQLNEALEWIEEHKSKSSEHDSILMILTYAITLCLTPALIFIFCVFYIGFKVGLGVILIFNAYPIAMAMYFMYTVISKIKKVSKNDKR